MGNGMLAQWRRGMVARGLATATLLAVPVAVAAAIGFEGSLGGLYDGLDAVVSGPETSQSQPAATTSDATPAALAGPAAAAGAPARGGGGNGGGGTGGAGDQTTTGGGGGGGTGGGGGGADGGSGDVNLPAGGEDAGGVLDPAGGGAAGGAVDNLGGAVDDLVQGVNNTVGGLLGGNGNRGP